MMTVLEGVVMELQDCALPLLAGMCIVLNHVLLHGQSRYQVGPIYGTCFDGNGLT